MKKNEEVVIMEKDALRQRIGNIPQRGTIVLTNKRLIFQPRLTLLTSPLFFGSLFLLPIGFILLVFPSVFYLSSEGFSFRIQSLLVIGILMTGMGVFMLWLAYRKHNPEIAMQLTDIVAVAADGEGGQPRKLRVKLRHAGKMDASIRGQVFETPDGGYQERFRVFGRDEFLVEVKIALKGEPIEVPSSLVLTQEAEVPKYSVPEKYPGVVVRLQKTYLTPKICCMCGEPASEKTVVARASKKERSRQSDSLAGSLTGVNINFTQAFPICSGCRSVFRRAKTAGYVGGILGLVVGGVIFVLLLFSGLLVPILSVVAGLVSVIMNLSDIAGVLAFWILLVVSAGFFGGIGWLVAREWARDAIATRNVPQDRKAFFKTVAADKGIKVVRSPGFVVFGFLSKAFATAFGQMNAGFATVVEMSSEEKKKRG